MKPTSLAISFIAAASLGACASSDLETAQANWREAIVTSPTAETGCFHAAFPAMSWEQVQCTTAPTRAFAQPTPSSLGFTVGNGSDYALEVTGLISQSFGTFPHVSGLVSEKDDGSKNTYSIQLNSNFMTGTAACNGIAGCMSWAQFVYSTSETSAFMQNWLIGYGATCPSTAWFSDGQGDCYINSAAATVPAIPISSDTALASLKMSGKAVNNGNDTLVFTSGTDAFTTSEADSITNLATAWNASEFNIVGDGGGTEAIFNKSTAIQVRIAVKDGSTTAPTCAANAGTTGETNNRVLGACTTAGGTEPSVEFKESGT